MPLPILPEARKVLRDALVAQPTVTTPIVFQLLAGQTWPVIRLVGIDDVELRPETNASRVQVEVWGNGPSLDDEDEVNLIAATLQSVSRDCDGAWASGTINNCRAPNRLPSPDPSGRVRVIVDFELEINQ
jgi:hypothetical protein